MDRLIAQIPNFIGVLIVVGCIIYYLNTSPVLFVRKSPENPAVGAKKPSWGERMSRTGAKQVVPVSHIPIGVTSATPNLLPGRYLCPRSHQAKQLNKYHVGCSLRWGGMQYLSVLQTDLVSAPTTDTLRSVRSRAGHTMQFFSL